MLDANKQQMKYSLQGQKITIYKKDEDGNIQYEGYTDSDGNFIPYLDVNGDKIPIILKEVVGYSEPKIFKANISNKLREVLIREIGVDDSSSYCQIVTDKGYLPLDVGDLVWKKSNVETDKDGLVDKNSADYIVKGVADEGSTVDLFLLQKIVR